MIYAHVVVVRNTKTVTVKTTNESMRFGAFQAAFALCRMEKTRDFVVNTVIFSEIKINLFENTKRHTRKFTKKLYNW